MNTKKADFFPLVLTSISKLPHSGQSQKIPLTGKVVWISHKQSGFKPQGFAIQLSGDKGIYYKAEAERILAGSMSLDRPSYTM
ncbi:pilus assembly protein [Acinetobacter baumannii]|nr:pilus assembly protein [Acinetobacter baumannii]